MGLLNLIVLTFEILFYSMFMKFAKNDGKFYKYVIVFIINTILITLLGSRNLMSYLVFVMTTLLMLKYVVQVKTSLYDMLVIIFMLIVKSMLEIPLFYLFAMCFSGVISTFLFQITKILLVLFLKDLIRTIYIKLKTKWDNNNFYIRYIFSILMFMYVIISCFFLISR